MFNFAKRSTYSLQQLPVPYYSAYCEAKDDLWSSGNPNGKLVLLVSENKLIAKPMAQLLQRSCPCLLGPIPGGGPSAGLAEDLAGYQDPRGRLQLREAMADFLRTTCMRGVERLTGSLLSLSCGAGTVMDLLFFILGDEGDGVLLPAPYYSGFDTYVKAHNNLVPIPVYLEASSNNSTSSSSSTTTNTNTSSGNSSTSNSSTTTSNSSSSASDSSNRPMITTAVADVPICTGSLIASHSSMQQAVSESCLPSVAAPVFPRGLLADQLEAALVQAESDGVHVVALCISNPNNPQGFVYSKEVLAEMMQWAVERGIHFVSDEVYANSVFMPTKPFTSAALLIDELAPESNVTHLAPGNAATTNSSSSISSGSKSDRSSSSNSSSSSNTREGKCCMEEMPCGRWDHQCTWAATAATTASYLPGGAGCSRQGTRGAASNWGSQPDSPRPSRSRLCSCSDYGELVHVIWSISKDLGLSGLRVGCIYSRNQLVHRAFACFGYYLTPSSYTQWMLEQLLTSGNPAGSALQKLVCQNKQQLAAVYRQLSDMLDQAGVPYTPASGGVFVWLDLHAALAQPTWLGEEQLGRTMAEEHHLLLSPGSAFHATAPGFFRMCWAAMEPAALVPAVAALKAVMQKPVSGPM